MSAEKAVLITGSSTGIGRACALHLDAMGFRVFAGVRRSADGEELQQLTSGRLAPVILDVTDGTSISAAAAVIAAATGHRLFGLVNNAGIAVGGPLEAVPVEDIRKLMEVNVIGMAAVTRACIPLLRQGGRIVTMGSVSGLFALPGLSVYAASKFALEAFTDALRVELRHLGISVSIIEPGTVETPIWDKGLQAGEKLADRIDPAVRQTYAPLIAFIRKTAHEPNGLSPETVAQAVARALTARKPKSRYPLGRDTALMRLVGMLPVRLRDWIVLRAMSLDA